ncbi:MAG: molybdopterin-binding protein [Pseudomonadota bacterium]
MRFGPVPVDVAEGAILAHSLRLSSGVLKKGRVLDAADLARIKADGVAEITVAQLAPTDIEENTAAARLAAAIAPSPKAACLRLADPFTGRVNLYAQSAGIVMIDTDAVHALNKVNPLITLATPRPFARVAAGALVGTVKIISYAVTEVDLNRACAAAKGAVRVQPATLQNASLILTELPGAVDSAKGEAAVASRLDALGVPLIETRRVPHQSGAVAQAVKDAKGALVLIQTASATSDPHDVAPEGLVQAGGRLIHFGMPVDPGNLLFLGAHGDRPVIGLPGCARSPALNGADWVMERILCGVPVTSDDIAAMGVGGLLKEIKSRPQPREG